MTGFDFAVLLVFGLSLLIGLWRGLVKEVLSLLGWPIAFVMSKFFAPDVAPILPSFGGALLQMIFAYALVFMVTLLLWSLLVWMLAKFVSAVGLGWLDRVLGALFGLIRGALIVLMVVWVAGLTSLPTKDFWREAKTSDMAEGAAILTKSWLPDSIAKRIRYG